MREIDPQEQKRREAQKQAQVQEAMERPDALSELVLYTLNNFSYRYFEQAPKAIQLSPGCFKVEQLEVGIKDIIKNPNPELREGLKSLLLRVSKEEGPTVLKGLKVEHDESEGQQTVVTAYISWGHPDHPLEKSTFVSLEEVIRHEDFLELRNCLARHLESVCELF